MQLENFPSYWSSEDTTELNKAVLEVQAKATTIGLDAANPFFKSKYASYHQIYVTMQPIFIEVGLTIQFYVLGSHLATKVTHVASGQFEFFNQKLALAKADPQGVGAAITYMKRYTLVSYFNLDVADIDDDGNTASGKVTKELPGLTPSHPKWKGLQQAVQAGKMKIESIKTQYTINPEHEKLLAGK